MWLSEALKNNCKLAVGYVLKLNEHLKCKLSSNFNWRLNLSSKIFLKPYRLKTISTFAGLLQEKNDSYFALNYSE